MSWARFELETLAKPRSFLDVCVWGVGRQQTRSKGTAHPCDRPLPVMRMGVPLCVLQEKHNEKREPYRSHLLFQHLVHDKHTKVVFDGDKVSAKSYPLPPHVIVFDI